MATYTDWDLNSVANASLLWEYDAASNIRRVYAQYKAINADGSLSAYDSAQDYWYKYDALDRMVTTKGVFTGSRGAGYIGRGGEGSDIAYDGAGQRATVTTGYTSKLESYGYNAAGYLTGVTISIGGGTTRTRATYSRDLLGRVTDYLEYDNAGVLVHARGDIEYNKRDQVLLEKTRTKQGSDWIYTHTVNYYSETGHAVAAPEITSSVQAGSSSGTVLYMSRNKNWKNGSSNPVYGTPGNYSSADLDYADAYTTNYYMWTDAAQQLDVQYVNRDGQTHAGYRYDYNGSLTYVDQTGGTRPRDISFTTDAQGRVLERQEHDNNYSQSDPRARHYRFGGIDMGTIGNDGSDNVDYDASIAARTAASPTTPGAFRGGATTGTPFADFDMAYDAVNGSGGDQGGGTASYYNVRQGDTLASIAQTVWGDASLWYMLAEANGLSGTGATAQLTEGTGLIVPDKGSNFHNNAATFRPYDAAAAIGDTQPGAPKPPKKSNKCGVFGQILQAIVTIAVTIVASTVVGPVAGAAIGSAAGQLYGMAIGIQSKFSFKQVALAALTAGVTKGISPSLGGVTPFGAAAKAGSAAAIGNAAVQGAIASAAVQGVAVATGLQKKFSWTAVAAAGVSAGVGHGIGHALNIKPMFNADGSAIPGANTLSNYAVHLGTSAARAFANASVRSLLDGSDFGDNIIASLPDVIGQTLGSMMALGVSAEQPETGTWGEPTNLLPDNFWDDPVPTGEGSQQLAATASLDPITQDRLAAQSGVMVTGDLRTAIAQMQASTSPKKGIVTLLDDPILGSDGGQNAEAGISGTTPDQLKYVGGYAIKDGPTAITTTAAVLGSRTTAAQKLEFILAIEGGHLSPAGAKPGSGIFAQSALDDLQAEFDAGKKSIGELDRDISQLSRLVDTASSTEARASLLANTKQMLYAAGEKVHMLSISAQEGIHEDGFTTAIFTLGASAATGAARSSVVANGERIAGEAAPLFSRIVPGGGLKAHETAGGHLLLKHVGQSESQLLARLAAEPKISGSSSFFNRSIAERAVAETLDSNSGKIASWLSGNSNRLPVDHTFSSPVGVSIPRGATSATNVNSVQLFLIRDVKLPTGYRVHTGYPKP